MPGTNKKQASASEYCVVCGGNAKQTIVKSWVRPTKPEVVVYDIECAECSDCGERFLDPDQLKALERKTNEAIKKAKNMLTGEQVSSLVEDLRKRTGLSETMVAKHFGVTRQELHRWQTNDRVQSPMADSYMQYVALNPDGYTIFIQKKSIAVPKRGRPKAQA